MGVPSAGQNVHSPEITWLHLGHRRIVYSDRRRVVSAEGVAGDFNDSSADRISESRYSSRGGKPATQRSFSSRFHARVSMSTDQWIPFASVATNEERSSSKRVSGSAIRSFAERRTRACSSRTRDVRATGGMGETPSPAAY